MKGNLAHEIALLPMISDGSAGAAREGGGAVFRKAGYRVLGMEQEQEDLDARLVKTGPVAALGLARSSADVLDEAA